MYQVLLLSVAKVTVLDKKKLCNYSFSPVCFVSRNTHGTIVRFVGFTSSAEIDIIRFLEYLLQQKLFQALYLTILFMGFASSAEISSIVRLLITSILSALFVWKVCANCFSSRSKPCAITWTCLPKSKFFKSIWKTYFVILQY